MRIERHAVMMAGLLTAASLAFPSSSATVQGALPHFTDIAGDIGVRLMNLTGDGTGDYIVGANGNGAGFFDYDEDGDIDLLIANGSSLADYGNGGSPMMALYRNTDGVFAEVTAEAGLERNGWGMGVCVADYDNDGFSDFYLTAYGPNLLYRNQGDGSFLEVSAAGVNDTGWGTNCAFGDYDRDGDVDLYVANYLTFDEDVIPRRGCTFLGMDVFCGPLGLRGERDTLYRNNGDDTFTDVTDEAGIVDPGHYGFGVLFGDYDDDGWPDVYVANDSVPNLLFQNNGDGTFREIGTFSGTALSGVGRAEGGMGVTSGDYDNDGDFDIFVTNFSQETNTLYENLGDMLFAASTIGSGAAEASFLHVGWGTGFEDLDNDGWLDLFVANGHVDPAVDGQQIGWSYLQPKEVYLNSRDGGFTPATESLGEDLLMGRSARGVAFGDYDNDGDIDMVAINLNDTPSVYRNDGGNRNHWISLRLEGTDSNHDAIGARVELTVGGTTQIREVRSGSSYLSHNDLRLHFGLGTETLIERLAIRWPSGHREEIDGIEADRFLTLREGAGVVEGP